jgi:hypothetical protein
MSKHLMGLLGNVWRGCLAAVFFWVICYAAGLGWTKGVLEAQTDGDIAAIKRTLEILQERRVVVTEEGEGV